MKYWKNKTYCIHNNCDCDNEKGHNKNHICSELKPFERHNDNCYILNDKDYYQGKKFLCGFNFVEQQPDMVHSSVQYVNSKTAINNGLLSFPICNERQQIKMGVSHKLFNGLRQ